VTILVAPPAATILEQTDGFEFSSSSYFGVGNYVIDLAVIPGLTSQNQIIPVGTTISDGLIISITTSFGAGHGILTVHVVNAAGNPADSTFFIHAVLVGV
jgi:hypothetical protein